MTLTKFGLPDIRPYTPSTAWAESPAQHRYPVWWTGDGTDLQTSVHSMVDAGVHDVKPVVHADCGGDYRGSAGDLLRWTGHCTYGTIFRYHGNDHRPWGYDNATTDTIRAYLQTRYRLVPSLIAFGAAATRTGFPLVGRCDLFWPTHPESRSNEQYVFLNDTLVAPIWDSKVNATSRSVWIPPGEWYDAWNGSAVRGPATLTVTQPYERIPLWHRAGGLVVTVDDPAALRIDEQDWGTLTLEAFPSATAALTTRRTVVERGTSMDVDAAPVTELVLTSDGKGASVHLAIGAPARSVAARRPHRDTADAPPHEDLPPPRQWLVRFHLAPRQTLVTCKVDGVAAACRELATRAQTARTPFGGRGAPPPPLAGAIVEVDVPAGRTARAIELVLLAA